MSFFMFLKYFERNIQWERTLGEDLFPHKSQKMFKNYGGNSIY